MISLNRVTKKYGQIIGLQDVSLNIEKGQIAGLLGRNGAGKTTALNLLTGYFPPDEGSVLVNGLDMMEKPAECKRHIGYLPECPPLYDEMTVTEYLNFVCDLKEVSPRARKAHVREILDICALTQMENRLIASLSKGYRQRVGIAQALCGSPDILILDEPTVGLDPKQIVEIRELIHRLGEEHTILFSTHILHEVQQLCSHAFILHEGKLIRSFDMNHAENSGYQFSLRLRVRGDGQRLLPAIRSIGCVQKAEILGTPEKGTIDLRVTGREQDERGLLTDQLFHLFAAMNTPIRQMVPEKNDLEEVFLQATSD